MELKDRLMARVLENERGCWEWQGKISHGYGRVTITDNGTKRTLYVHRLMYQLLVGNIPDGLVIDHLCRNTRCANPDHLEPVTPRENNLRGIGPAAKCAQATHCVNGHPFSTENTRTRRGGGRVCITCANQRDRCRRRELPDTRESLLPDYAGVTWDKGSQRWRARIVHEGKTIYLGRFKNAGAAAMAYNAKARELFGAGAYQNPLPDVAVTDPTGEGRTGELQEAPAAEGRPWRGQGTKLSPDDVRLIRRSTESNGPLARQLNVDKATIIAVRKGRTWTHIMD